LEHENGEAKTFYERLKEPAWVGIETTGYTRWFAEMLAALGHELMVGEAGKIRASETRKQKHDRRDAWHIMELMAEGKFPRIWLPSAEERDVRVLEQFHLLYSVSGAKKEALAVRDGNRLKGGSGRPQELFAGTGSVAAQDLFDLAPHGLDGIEIGRIRRQVQEPGTGRFQGLADSPDFVRGQIVHDHQVAGFEARHQPLLHPSQKHFSVHRTFKQPRGAGALQANAGDQGAGLIPSVGDMRPQPFAAQGAAAQARHLGVGAAFVHEHQMGGGFDGQLLMPARPFFGDVRTLLFGGDQSFF
jgi:hypothetical protein